MESEILKGDIFMSARVLADLTDLAGSYLRLAGIPYASDEVRRYVASMGALVSGHTSIRSVNLDTIMRVVAAVQAGVRLSSSQNTQQIIAAALAANEHGPLGGHIDPSLRSVIERLLQERRGADGPRSKSALYDRAGMSSSTDISIRGITAANYFTSPATRAIAGTGMSYGTFDWMRGLPGENFTRTHILHAGQDAARHGFGANNRQAVRDFGILSRDDGARRDERNALMDSYRRRLAEDADMRRLREERDKATGDARTAIERQMAERDRVIRTELGITTHIAAAPTAAAREAGQRRFDGIFAQTTGTRADAIAKLGHEDAQYKSAGAGKLSTEQQKLVLETRIEAKEATEAKLNPSTKKAAEAKQVTEAEALFGADIGKGPPTKTAIVGGDKTGIEAADKTAIVATDKTAVVAADKTAVETNKAAKLAPPSKVAQVKIASPG